MRHALLLLLTIVSLLAHGCQSVQTVPLPAGPLSPLQHCEQLLAAVDRTVVGAEATDTAVFRVPPFPFLRANRFLAGIAETETHPPAVRRWLEIMHQLDLAAREKELLNLDEQQFRQLADQFHGPGNREAFIKKVCACSGQLFAHERDAQGLPEAVRKAIHIPAEYRTWRRVVGLYPLVALPVAVVSTNVFNDIRAWHAMPPEELPTIGAPIIYRPAGGDGKNRTDPQSLFHSRPRDALGLPLLSPSDERNLVDALAPVIIQDTAAAYDRIGKVHWSKGTLAVAPSAPTGYYYLSHGRFNHRPSLQINYVFWYSHRTGDNAPWIEWGRLDGLTIRISLDQEGRPFMLDIMNNCGCYHFFVPDRNRIRHARSIALELDPLVPAWLPTSFPESRLALKVNSGWHQVQHILHDTVQGSSQNYRLRPYRELEMLPDENGQHRSIFNPDGIVWGSQRIEPVFFFSMGIPDIGAMRQRGHHAIKLIGRAHFDHPQLFDNTFEYR